MLTQSGTTVAGSDAAFLSESDPLAAFSDRSLLIVDDDKPFSTRLARAMEARGYEVHVAESVNEFRILDRDGDAQFRLSSDTEKALY